MNIELISEELFFGVFYIPYGYIDVVFFYFYIKTFLFPNKAISATEKWLYLPFLIAFSLTLYLKIGHATHYLSKGQYQFLENLEVIHDFLSLTFAILMLLISYGIINKYEKQQSSAHPDTIKVNLQWLKTLFFVMFIALFFWVVAFIEEIIWNANNNMYYYFLYVSISVSIYILGHIGLYKVGVLKERKKIRRFYADHSIVEPMEMTPLKNKHIIVFEKYIKEEKNYLNSQLSLDMVAEEIGINKSYLSRLINSELSVSFSNYVNQLRVEEMKTYINNPNFSNYTLTSMGLEAGFNSKSSFNKAFKKHTGISPSEYRKTSLQMVKKGIE